MRRFVRHIYLLVAVLLFLSPNAHAEWLQAETLDAPKDAIASVTMDGIAYFFGGGAVEGSQVVASDSVLAFDIEAREWVEPPYPLNFPRINATAAVVEGRIFVFGGRNSYGDYIPAIEMWEPGRTSWHIAGNLVTPREGLGCVVLNDTLYIVGGKDDEAYYDKFQRMDIQEEGLVASVVDLPQVLPVATSDAAVTLIEDHIFVIGGFNFGMLANIYRFSGSEWELLNTMEVPIGGMGYTTIEAPDGYEQALLLGGIGPDGDRSMGLTVDAEGGTELFNDPLPAPRSLFPIAFDGYDIVIAGGSIEDVGGRVRMNSVMVLEMYERSNATAPEPGPSLPELVHVEAYPNPSNHMTKITVNRGSVLDEVSLQLYNVLGRRVAQWSLPSGQSAVTVLWDGTVNGSPAGAGVYFLQSKVGSTISDVIKIHRLP